MSEFGKAECADRGFCSLGPRFVFSFVPLFQFQPSTNTDVEPRYLLFGGVAIITVCAEVFSSAGKYRRHVSRTILRTAAPRGQGKEPSARMCYENGAKFTALAQAPSTNSVQMMRHIV